MSIIDQVERAEAEPALVAAKKEVDFAKADIRELLAQDAEKVWTVREIQDEITRWRGTIVRLAIFDMERTGEIETANDLSIHVVRLQTV